MSSSESMMNESVYVFTYHKNHNVVSCVCGELINGKHDCKVEGDKVMQIRVKECFYESSRKDADEDACEICLDKEAEKAYEDQWDTDDGYCICSTCGDKCDGDLPKECSCDAYIDRNGEERCKSCDELWLSPYLDYGSCKFCGSDSETEYCECE